MSASLHVADMPQPEAITSRAFALFRGIRAELEAQASNRRESAAIAGRDIQMSFGSSRLAEALLPAFAHLRSKAAGKPALAVFLHDLSSAPCAAEFLEMFSQRGSDSDIWLADGPDLTVIAQANGRVVSIVDWQRDMAYWISRSAEEIPYLERAGPLRPLLCRWFGRHDRYFVHAAAVGDAEAGVLILGDGGSGKSTTALTCLDAGLTYAGDDHCIVSAEPEPVVHSLFSAGKLDIAEWHRFPAFIPAGDVAGRADGEKGVFFFDRLPDVRIARSMTLRALLLARITDQRRTGLRKLAPNQAFKALVPSCALHFQQERAEALQCFSTLARRLPAYMLELGSDLSSSPPVISNLLADLADQRAIDNAG